MGVKQKTKSLKARGSEFSNTFFQLEVLSQHEAESKIPKFGKRIKEFGWEEGIDPVAVQIFQINIGKLCNQTCAHCHVDAGPDKKEENIDRETLEKCLEIIKEHDLSLIHI